jgi:glycosyltransferase involved in cell wall biosynthesis
MAHSCDLAKWMTYCYDQSMKPLISVVIPAYNEEKLIAQCVAAVKNQTFPQENYEIIVVNNNSTDKTEEIAKAAGARVVFYDEKQGFSVAKQYGISQAEADIIVTTDADSIPDKSWLETIYQIMQNKKYACIGGSIAPIKSNFVIQFLFSFYDFLALINQIFGISLIWSPNMAFRKEAFNAIGGYNIHLKTSDDWDFIVRIQKKFGVRSTLYTNKLHVKTSSRKQENFRLLIAYIVMGIFNYISLFWFRSSVTFGTPSDVR